MFDYSYKKTRGFKLVNVTGGAGNADVLISWRDSGLIISEYVAAGVAQVVSITCQPGALIPAGSYFLIDGVTTTGEAIQYYVWFQMANGVDPLVAGRTGIKIANTAVDVTKTAIQVSAAVASAINTAASANLTAAQVGTTSVFTITDVTAGFANPPFDHQTGFTLSVTQQGGDTLLLYDDIPDINAYILDVVPSAVLNSDTSNYDLYVNLMVYEKVEMTVIQANNSIVYDNLRIDEDTGILVYSNFIVPA